MPATRTFRRFFLFAAALLLLPASPAVAGECCAATDPVTPAAEIPARRRPLAAVPWMYLNPVASHLPRRTGSRMFDYMAGPRLWLTGGLRTLPTGLLLTAETSNADRNTFAQAGLGLGYLLLPKVRAISSWNTGFGRYSVSPGSQFAVGVALGR